MNEQIPSIYDMENHQKVLEILEHVKEEEKDLIIEEYYTLLINLANNMNMDQLQVLLKCLPKDSKLYYHILNEYQYIYKTTMKNRRTTFFCIILLITLLIIKCLLGIES